MCASRLSHQVEGTERVCLTQPTFNPGAAFAGQPYLDDSANPRSGSCCGEPHHEAECSKLGWEAAIRKMHFKGRQLSRYHHGDLSTQTWVMRGAGLSLSGSSGYLVKKQDDAVSARLVDILDQLDKGPESKVTGARGEQACEERTSGQFHYSCLLRGSYPAFAL